MVSNKDKKEKSTVLNIKEDDLINLLIHEIKKRNSKLWIIVLKCLYDEKTPLSVCDVRKICKDKYNIKVWDNRIREILKKYEKVGIVISIELDGLKGKRWMLTELGKKLCNSLNLNKYVFK